MSEKASKSRFPKPVRGSKMTVTKEKERRKRRTELEGKKEKRKKAMVLNFYDSYFGDRFRPKKTVGPEQDPNWRKSLFVNPKTSPDFCTYFKDVIQYYYC